MAASLGDSRDRLKDLSLIFTGPYDGRPYARTDFRTTIEDATGEPVSTAVWLWARSRGTTIGTAHCTPPRQRRCCWPEGHSA